MKPRFALSLAYDGIALLHRAAGGWRLVGEVTLDTPDLDRALATLRENALMLEPDGLDCKLIIPNDQIRYLDVQTGDVDPQTRERIARGALADATPYDLDDLRYDLSANGKITHVAAVALETLTEAEAFAASHGFSPVSFVAVPHEHPFPGEPFFGQTDAAKTLQPGTVERDGIAVTVIGRSEIPPPPPQIAPQDTKAPQPAPPAADPVIAETPPAPQDQPPPAELRFASRRKPRAGDEQGKPAVAPPVPPPVAVAEPSADVAAAAPSAPASTAPQDKPKPATANPLPQRAPQPAVASIIADPPQDETARMTVFGARQNQSVRGKPRFLGLILTGGLLLFLALVAFSASFFDGGKPGFFGPRDSDLAPLTPDEDIAAPEIRAPDTAAPAADDAELSDTDAAVLDALRRADDQPADIDEPDPEDASELEPEPDTPQDAPEAALQSANPRFAAPPEPDTPAIIGLDDIYIASIDRTDLSQDAVALPPASGFETDTLPGTVTSPVDAGTSFARDASGLVTPTVDGALTPDGVLVYLGRPPVVPPAVPERREPVFDPEPMREQLTGFRPRLRPDTLAESNERSQLGGLSRDEMSGMRPRLRPESLTASIEALIADQVEPEPSAAQPDLEDATAQAVPASRKPAARPGDFAKTVQRAEPAPQPEQTAAAVAPVTVAPRIPSTASVAQQATQKNALNLRQVNLIGVYGTPANRRALVRLPNGGYKKVKVGDTVDGGRIVAIGDGELRYQKRGRTLTLTMPRG